MRLSIRLLMSVAALSCFASASHAVDDIPTFDLAPYLSGIAPAGMAGPTPPSASANAERAERASSAGEKQSAINGTTYAVVAPTYNSPTGTLSYLRLFNGANGPSNFTITIVGSPTGKTYGTANIQVGRSASPQYSLTQILQNANVAVVNGAGVLTGGDTSFSLYIQDPDTLSGYQHVTYNAASAFFENVSVCNSLLNQTVSSNSSSAVLMNVHTSKISDYPSQIELHNFWNAAVTYRLTAVDSTTGVVISAMNLATAPNASYAIPFTSMQTTLNFQPSASQFHVNLIVTDPSGAPPYIMLGQSIVNSQLAANISMSTACAVNNSSGSYAGGPGLNGY